MAETETIQTEPPKPIDKPTSTLARWTPSLPTNLMSVLNPFSSDDSDRASTDNTQISNKRSSFLNAILPINPPTTSSRAASPSNDDESMFAEPETRSDSDAASQEGSVVIKKSSSSRPKTSYSICHPPRTSTTRQRLHRRPRSLIQLHKLSANARPKPAFEVIPSANFSVKLRKATTSLFRSKHGLCKNDLIVLKAETYSTNELDEEQDARDVIALICKGRKEDGQASSKARICFTDGVEWEAYSTPQGGYEFFTTDEHGLGITVRWVPKRTKDGRKPSAAEHRKFNFSTISPNSRRHPVIATLSKTSLDINDTFKVPDANAVTPLSTPMQSSTLLAEALEEEGSRRDQCETDDRLREIITMSSIWVAVREGWSPFFKCEDRDKDGNPLQRSPSMQGSPSPSKSATFATSPFSTPPASPMPDSPALQKRASIKSVGAVPRKSGLFGRTSRTSTSSQLDDNVAGQLASSTPGDAKRSGRTRADSASTVLVHRAASNRMKNQQPGWQMEMLHSQHEIREQPSAEELTRSQSDGQIPTTSSMHQKRESIARPILPSAPNSSTDARDVSIPVLTSSPTRRRKSPSEQQSRSVSRSETTTSASDGSKKLTRVVKPKRSVLRRILCGSSDDT